MPVITFYDNFENIAALHPLMIESFISSNFSVLRFIGKDKEFKGAEISNAKRFLKSCMNETKRNEKRR